MSSTMPKNIRKTRLEVLTWLLIILVILLSHIFLMSKFLELNLQKISKHTSPHRSYILLKSIISSSKIETPEQLYNLNNFTGYTIDRQGFLINIAVTKKPQWQLQLPSTTTANQIANIIKKRNGSINLSYLLKNGLWFNYSESIVIKTFNALVMFFMVAVAIFFIIFLYLFSMRRLKEPLLNITQSANRLGIDINAKPLRARGPTLVRETIQTMNKMQHRIQDLISNRTRLLAAISHDLRTPLTRLKLRAQFISDEALIKKMDNDLDEMSNMIDAILSFSRKDTLHEQKKKLDLSALVNSICYDYIDTGSPVTLHNQYREIEFFGQPLSLKRAISNIINNGIKYGNRVSVSLDYSEGMISIKICDEGPGIPEDELKNVIQPFYRSKSVRSNSSTGVGLGLTIAHEVTLSHDGQLLIGNHKNGNNIMGLIVEIKLEGLYNQSSQPEY